MSSLQPGCDSAAACMKTHRRMRASPENIDPEPRTQPKATPASSAIDCAATTYRMGSWSWPDASSELQIWLMCASASEFAADKWKQKYVETTTDASFVWGGSPLSGSTAFYDVKAQRVRVKETSVTPGLPAGAWFDGVLTYFTCGLTSGAIRGSAPYIGGSAGGGRSGCRARDRRQVRCGVLRNSAPKWAPRARSLAMYGRCPGVLR